MGKDLVGFTKIIVVLLCSFSLFFAPLEAIAKTEQRNYLTLEILEELGNSIQKEGQNTIDLSNFIIDLANPDRELTRQFYQQIIHIISRNTNPIVIDLSNSIVRGNLSLSQLGISTFIDEGALSSLLTPLEQNKIRQYYPVVNDVPQHTEINILRGSLYFNGTLFTGEVDGSNSLFLQSFEATAANFQGLANFDRSVFAKDVNFSDSIFEQSVNFAKTHFFAPAKFNGIEFKGLADFSNSQFEEVLEFDKCLFEQIADFSHSVFAQPIKFSRTMFRDRLNFAKAKFLDSLILFDSTLEGTTILRDIYVKSLVNLQDTHILNKIDLSNAFFALNSKIDVSRLAFDSTEAKITGQPGIIGKLIKVDRLSGNEIVLRNLIRNFRSLEQITDANYIEYQQQRLRERQLGNRLTKTQPNIFTKQWFGLIPQWLGLNLLLLLGDYGTNINSIFSIGIITIAFFSLLFWLLDRYRPHISQPIVPTRYEIIAMLVSYSILTGLSLVNIILTTSQPRLSLMAIALVLIPLPIAIVILIYRRGRYHAQLDISYFVENGQFREFRLLLGRLPIVPRFPFFRDRFMPILWNKRWNWLNYYDFSLNNIFKIGFNDIRLRDRHLPGLISSLVWYQWCLGVLYIVLLLWTLSRTIPGLNLLIYF
jgi:hypothetical protein